MNSVSLVDGHIDEPKLTDEQIIKALERCGNIVVSSCKECAFHKTYNASCVVKLMKNTLDLINRQKAENERLEYVLMGVMHSVDKWLEGDELKQDEVNRAATMREKTLQMLEDSQDGHIRTAAEKDAEIERLQKHNKEYGFCNLLGNCLVYSKNLKDYNDMRKGLKSEARKEFANELKRICVKDGFVDRCDIMRLLKEMDGEQNDR